MTTHKFSDPFKALLPITIIVGFIVIWTGWNGGKIDAPTVVRWALNGFKPMVSQNTCVANLNQIDGAKMQWAIENKKGASDTPTKAQLYGPRLYLKVEPECPRNGVYTIGKVGKLPTCSMATGFGHSL